jgi:nucleotide-binding universal stress UspA family protein
MRHIVVGVNGSVPSLRALRWSAGVADDLRAEIVAAYATGPLIEWVSETSPSSWRHLAQSQVDQWISDALDGEVVVCARLVEDARPVVALASEVARSAARLVVVGAQRAGGLGAIPLRLASEARTPVVVVP